jgi:hypothetical protein
VVNKPLPVKIEATVRGHTARVLGRLPDLVLEQSPRNRLRTEAGSFPIAVEFKARVGPAQAWQLARSAETLAPARLLVVCDEMSSEARRILKDAGVAYVDDRGWAHARFPGFYVHLEPGRSEPARPQHRPSVRLTGRGAAVGQVLLMEKSKDWSVSELASTTGVSAALAYKVLARLESEGLVAAAGRGPQKRRHVVQEGALLDLIAEESRTREVGRFGLHILAPGFEALANRSAKLLEEAGVEHVLTGSGAAAMEAAVVTSVPTVEMWVGAGTTGTQIDGLPGARRADAGANLLLRQSGDDLPLLGRRRLKGQWLANPVRVYLDLRNDPRRGESQARAYREEVLRV